MKTEIIKKDKLLYIQAQEQGEHIYFSVEELEEILEQLKPYIYTIGYCGVCHKKIQAEGDAVEGEDYKIKNNKLCCVRCF